MFLVNYLTQDLFFYQNDYSEMQWDHLKRVVGVSEGIMTKFQLERLEPLKIEIAAFVQVVNKNEVNFVNGEDALETLRLAESVLKSGHTGCVIEFT